MRIFENCADNRKNFRNSTYGPNIYQNFEAALIIGKKFRM